QPRTSRRTAEPRQILARLPGRPAGSGAMARVCRRAEGISLSSISKTHARTRILHGRISLALHAQGLLGLAAPRRPPQTRIAHLLLQHTVGLGRELGRTDAHPR